MAAHHLVLVELVATLQAADGGRQAVLAADGGGGRAGAGQSARPGAGRAAADAPAASQLSPVGSRCGSRRWPLHGRHAALHGAGSWLAAARGCHQRPPHCCCSQASQRARHRAQQRATVMGGHAMRSHLHHFWFRAPIAPSKRLKRPSQGTAGHKRPTTPWNIFPCAPATPTRAPNSALVRSGRLF